MRIDVKTLPVNEILKDIAESLDTEVEDSTGKFTVDIPENIGEGYIRGCSFDSGIGYVTYNCKFFEDVEIHFSLIRYIL